MSDILTHEKLLELIEARRVARSEKDWSKADEIKKQINDGGYWIKDHEDGGTSYDRIMPHMHARLQITTEGGEPDEVRKPETETVTQLQSLPKTPPKKK